MRNRQEEQFPRAIYDTEGRYTVDDFARYEVKSPSIGRYAAVVHIRRDLDTALEILQLCASDEECPGTPLATECLWIAAIVTYGKALTFGRGRKAFEIKDYIASNFDPSRRRLHDYVMKLRDKMIAHDDSVGAEKKLSIALTPQPPAHPLFFGIGGGNRWVVSLGTDIAMQLVPHFECMTHHFRELEAAIREQTQRELLATRFADVTILGHYQEEDLDVSIDGLLGSPSDPAGVPEEQV